MGFDVSVVWKSHTLSTSKKRIRIAHANIATPHKKIVMLNYAHLSMGIAIGYKL
jgi:hypothetical protein